MTEAPAFLPYGRQTIEDDDVAAVAEDFSYASNTNTDWLSAEALMAMVEEKAAA